MKKKKVLIIAISALIMIVVGAFLYLKSQVKEAYDYSDFYEASTEVIESDEETVIEKEPEMVLSLQLLYERNSDVVGILKFDDIAIYEPIVQAPDNKYYERKNIDRAYAAAGIPFVSADGNIYSKNVVIFGHSSAYKDIIFTPLMNYTTYSYYSNHPTFTFETFDEIRTYEIFAVISYDTNDINDSLEFIQTSWRKQNEFESFIRDIKEKSFYKTDVTVKAQDSIMTLVTCDNRDNLKRIAVLAKLLTD